MQRISSAIIILFTLALATGVLRSAEEFDLVINNGRVLDPESGRDATRHVGILAGRIVAISDQALAGADVIDATGLIVAPGFIDLHEHGQT